MDYSTTPQYYIQLSIDTWKNKKKAVPLQGETDFTNNNDYLWIINLQFSCLSNNKCALFGMQKLRNITSQS